MVFSHCVHSNWFHSKENFTQDHTWTLHMGEREERVAELVFTFVINSSHLNLHSYPNVGAKYVTPKIITENI